MSSHDPEGEMRRFGLVGRAERIVHDGRPWVLVRFAAHSVRYRPVARGNGITEYVEIREPFVPFDVACEAATMDVRGAIVEAHALSPCRDTRRIVTGDGMPMYLVFPYPEPGPVTVYLPITVRGGGASEEAELRLSVLIPEGRQ